MIRQYYTLEHIANELQCLWSCRITECFSQEKDTVIIVFYDMKKEYYLQYSADKKNNSLYLRKQFSRARKNTVDLFPEIIGETLQEFSLFPSDRLFHLKLIYSDIYLTLFGGTNCNLYIVDKENKIISSLNNAEKLAGTIFSPEEVKLIDITDFPAYTPIIKAIAQCSSMAGKYYAEEICRRLNIEANSTVAEFHKDELFEIENEILKLRRECRVSRYVYILENDSGKKLLSLIPLKSYNKISGKYESLSEAIERKIISDIISENFAELAKALGKRIGSAIHKANKTLDEIRNEEKMLANADKYRQCGELLMSQPNVKQKAGDIIKVKAWTGSYLEISLDNKLTLHQNAENYFQKARNTEKNITIRRKRLPELETRLKILNELDAILNAAKNIVELEMIKKEMNSLQGIKSQGEAPDLSEKFRRFELGEGFVLYVGKNAANNEELTLRFAKPNDLWLHSRGAGGSHCVMPLAKGQKPPKEILRKAAAIAAYYSQARGSKYAPVAYTYKKYVRKPKGANVGSVVISREEVIMVEPGLVE